MGSLNTTPATWVSGAVVTAAQMNLEVRDAVTTMESAFTAWTPTVSAGLTVGNGTWTGAYERIGKLIIARFSFTLGTTSSVTAGVVLVPPVNFSGSYPGNTNCGSGNAVDFSAGSAGKFTIGCYVVTAGTFSFSGGASGSQVTTAAPMTWATSDILSGTLIYEAT